MTHHALPICATTGLPRYRDRHQARHGAEAIGADRHSRHTAFACGGCNGYHLEKLARGGLYVEDSGPSGQQTAGQERFILVDIENLTRGRASREEITAIWSQVRRSLHIGRNDRVVIGSNRHVARKFATAIAGPNITWVVGGNEPDGADRALLMASDIHRIARDFTGLVLLSGDHAFAELARMARHRNLPVEVAATTFPGAGNSVSRQLREQADRVTTIRVASIDRTTQMPAA